MPGFYTAAKRGGGLAAIAVAASLVLTGCGDVDDLDDLNDLIDRAQEFVDEASEGSGDPGSGDPGSGDPGSGDPGSGDEGSDDEGDSGEDEPGSDYEERMREAREDWDTYPAPPADIPPSEAPYDYATTHNDGSRSATEQNTYPGNEAEDLADYYTEQYGSEPIVQDGKTTWTNDNAITEMETNWDGSVTVESKWYDPSTG